MWREEEFCASDWAPCGNGLCDGGCRVCQGDPPPDPLAGFKSVARRNGLRALPAPVDVPWYAGSDVASYSCRCFPQGDYGADTWEDARMWLAIDPPPAGLAGADACIIELAVGPSGGLVERYVWPEHRFGDPA